MVSYTSVSSQIDSPAIGYVKDTAELYIINETQTAHNQPSNTIKLQTHNQQSEIFCGHIYVHTNKQPRIAPHLLHDYLPITNALGN